MSDENWHQRFSRYSDLGNILENEALFSRMMKAHVDAILSYVNTNVIEPGEEPFMEETVDWDCVLAEFCWPKELQKRAQK